MKYFLSFLKQHKGKAILALFLLLGQVAGTLFIPALIAKVVDLGILKGDLNVIKEIGLQMLFVAVAASLISICGSFVTSDFAALFGREIRSKLFDKIWKLSLSQFNQTGVSSLITRSTSDITNIQQTLGMMLQLVVPAPLIILVSMIMTSFISPVMALIQLGFMLILLTVSIILLKKSNSLSKSIQVRLDGMNKIVRETITGVRVIRAFGNERYEETRSANTYGAYADNMIKLNRLFAIFNPIVWLLMGGLMVVSLGLGGAFSLQGTMEVGQITAVIEYATLTMAYLMMAVASLTTLPKAKASLARLEEILDAPMEMKDNTKASVKKAEATPAVEFDHVTFSYSGAEEAVIRDLSFKMYPGETTAIIGSTGSGKSTLADLLLRFHDIPSGCIRLNGTNIRKLPLAELRNRIGCVPQKAFLFSGTIADNLRMGNEDATEEELWNAIKIAKAYEFVKSLPEGLLAPVSQGGTNFSGGQKQRLAIARALVKKAELFVFDDSFSALDVKTDAALRLALKESMSSPAKLIIAQRISSIMDAEQILVLDQGELIDKGTHQELLNSCQVYRDIADSQMNRKEA